MASSATLDLARLQLGPVITSQKGAKSAAFNINGTVPYWTPAQQMICPFDARSFDGTDASRVSICLRPDSDVQDQLLCLDRAVLNLAQEHSTALFGKELTLSVCSGGEVPELSQDKRGPCTAPPLQN